MSCASGSRLTYPKSPCPEAQNSTIPNAYNNRNLPTRSGLGHFCFTILDLFRALGFGFRI